MGCFYGARGPGVGKGIVGVLAALVPASLGGQVASEEAPRPGPEGLPLAATVVVEGAASGGDRGLLQLVSVAVEPELGRGFEARVEFLGKWGHDGAVGFPSSQGLSSLDAADFRGPGEAWVSWTGEGGVRVKAGWVDANAEFAASEAASAFANPSFGLTPTLAFMPSYPAPQPSLNAFVPGPGESVLGMGAYRGTDGDWSAVVQALGPVPGASSLRWQAGLATCRHLVEAPEGEGEPSGYLIVDWTPSPAVAGFVKLARAEGMRHVAAGLTSRVRAPVDLRAGLAASRVSDPAGEEVVAELFAEVRAATWLVVQPDVQVRLAPGRSPAAAGLLRVVVER